MLTPQILRANLQLCHRPPFLMTTATSTPWPRILPPSTAFRRFCTSPSDLRGTHLVVCGGTKRAVVNGSRVTTVKAQESLQLKEKWLDSISCPFPVGDGDLSLVGHQVESSSAGLEWVVGIDPDTSGALALLKFDHSGCSAQVFDTPHLQVLVGKRARKRPDAKSIVQLLRSLGAPLGTTSYIEQSTPFPGDGKQGWWSGGYTYGLWIGILVASGYSVVPVVSRTWKDQFELSGRTTNKDDSRRLASMLFPSMTSMLQRKKDHGRAEALLIAAYGKGLKVPVSSGS